MAERTMLEASVITDHAIEHLRRCRAAILIYFFVILIVFVPWFVFADNLEGLAHVIDGDTIVVGDAKVRLQGIDAPETDQVCLNERGSSTPCGIESRNQLFEKIEGKHIICELSGLDRYRRFLGLCHLDQNDINEWMVRNGWAIAFVRYSTMYSAAEKDARENRRGLWKGAFIAPWDWRHRNNKTVILGTASVPVDAQIKLLTPASAAAAPSSNCIIKGNVNRRGERIYHMPGQTAYAQTRMDKGLGERWFCFREEAETAGWRPAAR